MTNGMSLTVFERLMAYFAGEEDIQKAVLFGSRARGTAAATPPLICALIIPANKRGKSTRRLTRSSAFTHAPRCFRRVDEAIGRAIECGQKTMDGTAVHCTFLCLDRFVPPERTAVFFCPSAAVGQGLGN
ncbi:nucleotidyltransferase domain-containing protein [Geobacillus subterraneus]|uniref:nucleotidyltransferase domain-containing protein n=1 Tax=Geobacillus subterraneus TaxID=129338 RepID=UPI002AC8FFFC|nr:nucleotidyltransferase domain-containing protein [Geobacillus subterraneus]WPZ17311.1 nucleotidyltransferase domain-containing protein [Geobacillus subterraneus]